MGWLNLATKAASTTWRVGSKATSSLWNGGSAVVSTLWKGGSKAIPSLWNGGGAVVSAVTKHPIISTAVGVGAYAGWNKLPDESMGTAVGKSVREGVSAVGDFSHDVVNGATGENTVEQVKETVSQTTEGLQDVIKETKGVLGSVGETISGLFSSVKNIFSGEGGLFSNLGNGMTTGIGIVGLIGAAFMIFGRSGIISKIGGAVMGLFMLGMLGSQSQQQAQPLSQDQTLDQNENVDQQHGLKR